MMNKKVEISHIELYAGREYDINNRPARWASADATVYLHVGEEIYPYEVISILKTGTGSVYNEIIDRHFCYNVDEVNVQLHALRETIKYYKDKYEED